MKASPLLVLEHFHHPEKEPCSLRHPLHSPHSFHRHLLIYFLSLWIFPVWILHSNRVIQYVIFWKVLGPLVERHECGNRSCLACGEKTYSSFLFFSTECHFEMYRSVERILQRAPIYHHLDFTIYSIGFITNLSIYPRDHHLAMGSQGSNFQPPHVEKKTDSVSQNAMSL